MTPSTPRDLHLANPLMHGPDVRALQVLLSTKGFPVLVDGVFGPETGAACVAAKKFLGYAKADQTPYAGKKLLEILLAHPPFEPPHPVQTDRVRYVAILRRFLAEKENWDYTGVHDPDVRPIPHKGHKGRVRTDCSGAVTYAAEVAEVSDPNGLKFSGLGYTGTLLDHCAQVTRRMIVPGDLVVFGRYPGHHVVAVLTVGEDPLCFSHGKQGDPREVALSVELAYQPSPASYLRFL